MDKELKICVVGGGSSYTPELIEGFIENWRELPVHTIVLMDIDPRKLTIVGGLAERMVKTANSKIRIQTSQNREAAIEGADYVVSQVRVGGMQARILDESIPPKYGMIGQETTGPGGFAKALRTIPVILEIAKTMEKLAPNAFLLNFTNPAGLITEAVSRYSEVPVIGLCNLPIGAEMHYARLLGVDRSDLKLDWVGLNHLNWIKGAKIAEEDVWEKIFTSEKAEARNRKEDDWGFSLDILEALQMIPCGYLNYYYNHSRILIKQQKATRTRGAEVQEIEDHLMRMYQDPDLHEKPKLLEKRGGAYYSKAAVSLISSLENDKKETHIVNTVNSNTIPDLPPEGVIEAPCIIDRSGAHPIHVGALPQEVKGLAQAVKSYEELTAQAAFEGDRRKALLALLAHPLTPSFEAAKQVLGELLTAHKNYLPQFFPGG